MDDIRLVITNPSNVNYKNIVLRKFFYMIFIDADGRKLYLYIASVFGGTTESTTDAEKAYKSIKNIEAAQCRLKFDYSFSSGIVDKVNISNLTSSFFKQKKYLEAVWGECEEKTDQVAVSAALKELYPELYSEGIEATVNVEKPVYYIREGKEQSHRFIATEGDYRRIGEEDTSRVYELSCPKAASGSKIDGLEAMNWIKIEMDLKWSILNKPVLFSIKLDKGTFFTPDFTWYFAPPPGHIIGQESYVKIGDRKEQNAIQSVSDETTVYFTEWTKPPESIQERKKSRIIFKAAGVTNISKLSDNETLGVSLHLENPQGPTNRQFFMGLLVAFILSFCSDKTRMNDFYKCLHSTCTCIPMSTCSCQALCDLITIAAPVLLLSCFLSFVMAPKDAIPSFHNKYSRYLSAARFIGILSTCLLVLYIYVLWLLFPTLMRGFITCSRNKIIIVSAMIVSLLSNMIYLVTCLAVFKRRISNFYNVYIWLYMVKCILLKRF